MTLQTTYSEKSTLTLSLALLLFDGFNRQNRLVGVYADPREEQVDAARVDGAADLIRHTTVRLAGLPLVPFAKTPDATFLFFGLTPGAYLVQIRSPFYLPRDIPLGLPMPNPRWPAFPDVNLADENLPLDAAGQPPAYRAQRALATLQPTARYPFPEGATLARGTVRAGGNFLAGAAVRRTGQSGEYVTEPNGQYVLPLAGIAGVGQTITLNATHPLHASVSVNAVAVRGMTVVADIAMV